jgi:hypothetical protein
LCLKNSRLSYKAGNPLQMQQRCWKKPCKTISKTGFSCCSLKNVQVCGLPFSGITWDEDQPSWMKHVSLNVLSLAGEFLFLVTPSNFKRATAKRRCIGYMYYSTAVIVRDTGRLQPILGAATHVCNGCRQQSRAQGKSSGRPPAFFIAIFRTVKSRCPALSNMARIIRLG